MGSTGSTWFAKLLNSHPDVLCTHEGVISRVHPAREYNEDDILDFIDSLQAATAHGAYRAIGDVGSVWMTHVSCLPAFSTAILIRHPARTLHTRLRVFPNDQSYSEIAEEVARSIRIAWGLDLYAYEPIDQIFLNDLLVFASQTWAMNKVDLWIRIEDLSDLEYCQSALESLTGIHYPASLVLHARQNRVNVRTDPSLEIADIMRHFSRRQRNWYGELLSDAATLFGYNLWNDERAAPSFEEDLRADATNAS